MRRAAAALLIASALAAQAQTPPPESAPPQPPQAAPEQAPPAAPAAEASSPPPSPGLATQEEERPAPRAPAVRSAPARAQAPPPAAAPPRPAAEHDQELQTLRAQVSRLQSELDAERAAAVQLAEEAAGTAPARGVWGWLALAALLALAAGFVLGWRVLDRRIRRKYGGLRIY